jgi:transcriptional regulator with XRE-family HTH domain
MRAMTTHPLRAWRQAAGISQEELAGKVGTTKSVISRIETGARDASAELLRKIADVTGNQVTPNDVLLRTEPDVRAAG